ncbi:MAG: 50S ribosomal protein L29 [Calditrichaeota bacterium]|nr:50S ribosomal protein L29 [Calditrichota bacterium]MCB0269103.1 50S ribosomal protein L29 [Calditrichota bacterium]MCB0299462.1 50S ribosomal protein L29 [Calditrichota bacterium]MCB9067033.1 50S ribosomal protein L29 [Calditrichia bacterium]
MNTAEIKALPEADIKQHLDDLMDELANLRIQKATHQLTNPSRIREVKREIARAKTIMREIELGIVKTKES